MLEIGGQRQIKGLFLLPPAPSEAILQSSAHGGKARRADIFTGRFQILNYGRGEYNNDSSGKKTGLFVTVPSV